MTEVINQLKNMSSTDPRYIILLDELLHCDKLSLEDTKEVLLLAERLVKGDEIEKERKR